MARLFGSRGDRFLSMRKSGVLPTGNVSGECTEKPSLNILTCIIICEGCETWVKDGLFVARWAWSPTPLRMLQRNPVACISLVWKLTCIRSSVAKWRQNSHDRLAQDLHLIGHWHSCTWSLIRCAFEKPSGMIGSWTEGKSVQLQIGWMRMGTWLALG